MGKKKKSKILTPEEQQLRAEIIQSLEELGFKVTENELILPADTKEFFKKIQIQAKIKSFEKSKKFLLDNVAIIRKYTVKGSDLDPSKIKLELRVVTPRSLEEIIFKWWNWAWWSMPYQNPIGRTMRFVIWDTYHNAPFGLISLRSPMLHTSIRDQYLGLNQLSREERIVWINKSMDANRLGALPPYNILLGGKMAALTVVSNEIREHYREKYGSRKVSFWGNPIDPNLLFITTTSAFGRSSIYNRLKYKNEKVAISLGYTKGFGSFHISDELYNKIKEYLKTKGMVFKDGKERSSSERMKVLSNVSKLLNLPVLSKHNIPREFFFFPLVKNLKEVIHEGESPIYYDRPFLSLFEYWRERWLLPRAERKTEWRHFDPNNYINSFLLTLAQLEDNSNTLF